MKIKYQATLSKQKLRGSTEKLMREPCVLMDYRTIDLRNKNDEIWNCILSTNDHVENQSRIVQILGLGPYINSADVSIIPGKTMITVSPKIRITKSNKIRLNKEGLNVKFTEDHTEERIQETRRLNLIQKKETTKTTGVKTVLAVRITATNTQNSFSEHNLEKNVFRKKEDWEKNWNLANAMSKCSFGQLEIISPAFETGGVITVKIDNAVTYEAGKRHSWKDTIESIKDEAKKKLDELYGDDIYDLVDEVMYCIPKIGIWNDGNGDYMAKASGAGGQWTVYNDEACLKPSLQMHEIGHNLDIAHAGNKEEDGNRYSDTSGVMGSSYGSFGGPIMCFHGAANYQLGWFQKQTVSLDNSLKLQGKLVGLVDYDNDKDKSPVLINIDDGTDRRYIMSFNRKSSFNSGTNLGGDQVLIHERSRDGTWSQSWIVAKMGKGGEHILSNIGQDGNKKRVMIKVVDIDLNAVPAFAKIIIAPHENNNPTKEPTLSPTDAVGKDVCGVNTKINVNKCPTEKSELNIFNCKRVAYGELCNGKGECGTDVNLNNCGIYDIYRKTSKTKHTSSPTLSPVKDSSSIEAQGINVCGTNIPLDKKECPTKKSKLNVQNCEKASYGELCEGDGECGTTQNLDNCIFEGEGYDIYRKTELLPYLSSTICGDIQPIPEEHCLSKKKTKKLKKCKKAKYGKYCKGDKTCGSKKLNNCHLKYDVYEKKEPKK